jgi:hypothetical protein
MKIIYWVRKIPVIGNIVWIANAYAFRGDARSRNELAPIYLWVKAFFWNFLVSFSAAALTVYDFTVSVIKHFSCGSSVLAALPNTTANPGGTIVSVFPNLLGLGIGIYALLYALDTSVVNLMHQRLEAARRNGQRRHGSVLMINSDMAFPLCALLLIIAFGLIAQIFPGLIWLQVFTWIALWYGILLILELIVLLFALIDNSLLGKIEVPPSAAGSPDTGGTAPVDLPPRNGAPTFGEAEVQTESNERHR